MRIETGNIVYKILLEFLGKLIMNHLHTDFIIYPVNKWDIPLFIYLFQRI